MFSYKSSGDALRLWSENRELMRDCIVFRDATKHFGNNKLVGVLYRIRNFKVERFIKTLKSNWQEDRTLQPCLLGIEGREAEYHLISEEEAKRILIEWGLDPSDVFD
jgi:hypothetical protein